MKRLYSPDMYPENQLLFEAKRNCDLLAQFEGLSAEEAAQTMRAFFDKQSGIFYTFSPGSEDAVERAEMQHSLLFDAARSIFYYKLASEAEMSATEPVDFSIATVDGNLKVQPASIDELDAVMTAKKKFYKVLLNSEIKTPAFNVMLERFDLIQQEFLFWAINERMLYNADISISPTGTPFLFSLVQKTDSWWISQYQRLGLEVPKDLVEEIERQKEAISNRIRGVGRLRKPADIFSGVDEETITREATSKAVELYQRRKIFERPVFVNCIAATKQGIVLALKKLGYIKNLSYVEEFLNENSDLRDSLYLSVADDLKISPSHIENRQQVLSKIIRTMDIELAGLKESMRIEKASPHPEEFTIRPRRK